MQTCQSMANESNRRTVYITGLLFSDTVVIHEGQMSVKEWWPITYNSYFRYVCPNYKYNAYAQHSVNGMFGRL